MSQKEMVFVGLSGGVDSSVAAARLVRAGYAVTGVFIQVWQPAFLACNWEAERVDAMRVCAQLGIPFLTFDASEAYRAEVVDYMVREYAAGRTPNPDVMCNRHVKFGAFLSYARAQGARYVATGHYARIHHEGAHASLLRGRDAAKDQSYFLWTLTRDELTHILFPLGDMQKDAVRREARRCGLPTAAKPDSQGVCFLGELDMREFLFHFIPREPGPVINAQGVHIGTHDGARFYTLGQRHGFSITSTHARSTPHYVIAKDIAQNTLTVSPERPAVSPRTGMLALTDTNWIQDMPETVVVQTRYHGPHIAAHVTQQDGNRATVHMHESAELPAPGQSCVVYDGDRLIGGGICA